MAATSPTSPAGEQRWPLVVLMLWLVYLVHGIDRTVMYVLLQPISVEFGLTDTEVGTLAGVAYILPFAAAGIPLGALADRVTRKRLLSILLALWSGMTILASRAAGFGSLVAIRAVIGAAEGGAPPTILSIVSDAVPPRARATAVSILLTGPYAGLMGGSLLGGFVAAKAGWRMAVLVAGVPGLALAGLIWLALREPERGRWSPQQPAPESGGETLSMLRPPDRALTFVAIVLSGVAPLALAAWMPIYLVRAHGLTLKAAGSGVGITLGLLAGIGTLAGGPLSALLAGRTPARTLLFCAVTMATAIPAALLTLTVEAPALAFVALGSWAMLANLSFGPSFSVVIGTLPARRRGTALAMLAVGSNLLGALGPQVAGLASDMLKRIGDETSLRDALLLCLLVMPVQACAFMLASRHASHNGEAVPRENQLTR